MRGPISKHRPLTLKEGQRFTRWHTLQTAGPDVVRCIGEFGAGHADALSQVGTTISGRARSC